MNRMSILIIGCWALFSAIFADALPYLNQTPPDTIPQIFAPGIVSNTASIEFSCSFSSDAKEIYFYRYSNGSIPKIMSAKVVNGEWTEPADFSLTSEYPALEPHITLDNQRLYFGWNVGNTAVPGGIEGGIYLCQRTETGWSNPVLAGQGMYITSDLTGQLYITDLSTPNNGIFLAKVLVDNMGIFTGFQRLYITPFYNSQAHPCIAPDNSYILFDVEGGQHMFVSFKKPDGSWSSGIDLTSHGFENRAGGPYLSPDGKYLFFHKDGDIWWVDSKKVKDLNPYAGIGDNFDHIPDDIQLFQNYPNPFNPVTTIEFSLSKDLFVTISIYNVKGELVAELGKRIYISGVHAIEFNAENLESGAYFYQLNTAEFTTAKKMLIIK